MQNIPKDTQEALDKLPNNDIQIGDKVFPVRILLNTLIDDNKYILENSVLVQNNKTLTDGTDWDTLPTQSVYDFENLNGSGLDGGQLLATSGLVFTFQCGEHRLQLVRTEKGSAYRLDDNNWIYVGRQVPIGVDAESLVDSENMVSYLAAQLKPYVTQSEFTQSGAALSESIDQSRSYASSLGQQNISLTASNASVSVSQSAITSSSIHSLDSARSTISASVENNTSGSISDSIELSGLNQAVSGSVTYNEGQKFYSGGVFGSSGLSDEIDSNTRQIASASNYLDNLNTYYSSLNETLKGNSNAQSAYESAEQAYINKADSIRNTLKGSIASLNAQTYLPDKAYRVNDTLAEILPQVVNVSSSLASLASTAYVNGYKTSTVYSADSLSASNLDILGYGDKNGFSNISLNPSYEYQLTAQVSDQSANVSPNPEPQLEPVLGTIGLKRTGTYGNPEYQELNSTTNSMVTSAYDSDNSMADLAVSDNDSYSAELSSLKSVMSGYASQKATLSQISSGLRQALENDSDIENNSSATNEVEQEISSADSTADSINALIDPKDGELIASYSSINSKKALLVDSLSNVANGYIPASATQKAISLSDVRQADTSLANSYGAYINSLMPSLLETSIDASIGDQNYDSYSSQADSIYNSYSVHIAAASKAKKPTYMAVASLAQRNSSASCATILTSYSRNNSSINSAYKSLNAKVTQASDEQEATINDRNNAEDDFLRYKFAADANSELREQVKITYPITNDDIEGQLYQRKVDIHFRPLADETVDFISVPHNPQLQPPVFTNIQLQAIVPISTDVANTNSLLADDTNTMTSLSQQISLTSSEEWNAIFQEQEKIDSNSGIVQRDSEIASSAYQQGAIRANSLATSTSISYSSVTDEHGYSSKEPVTVSYYQPISQFNGSTDSSLSSGIGSIFANAYNISNLSSEVDSEWNSAPHISLVPTESMAASLSTNDVQHVYIYPNYSNDKAEEVIDWCLNNINYWNVQTDGNWKDATYDKVEEQVKNLIAGIVGNIEAVEQITGGNVADPQTGDIADWTNHNYLDWQWGDLSKWTANGQDNSVTVTDYLNQTLMNTNETQEWQGWNAYLSLHDNASDCGKWLRDKLGSHTGEVDSDTCGEYADRARRLLY